MKKALLILLITLTFNQIRADEGMWMLPLIEKLNIQKMQGLGCTLNAGDIYSDKNVSLKDAVIIFGGGCTGVVVSNQGLVFTNHHCGFGAIQQLSAVDHNYLKNGFTAKELKDEIPAPGLTVKFLVSITDVTEKVLGALSDTMSFSKRAEVQDSVMTDIKKEFGKDNHYIVQVKSFYSDNEFYVFMLEEFKDIRLAYTPPSSIGKFGGDTDNWMWPRHTGDFSVFRVYADSTGKPADYAASNLPYSPKRSAVISLDGVKPGDYTMIIGHPGTTTRYLTAAAIENRMKAGNQARIDIRGVKQNSWMSFMKEDEAIKIAYASKYARSSNYWKNSIGMNKAIIKLGVIERKKAEEKAFTDWVNENPVRQIKYGQVLPAMERNYKSIFPTLHAINYLRESLMGGIEMPRIAFDAEKLISKNLKTDTLLIQLKELYTDYVEKVDKATFSLMLQSYRNYVNKDYLPEVYQLIDKKFKGDYKAYADYVYEKSSFSNYNKLEKKILSGKRNFPKDPALSYRSDVSDKLKSFTTDAYSLSRDTLDNCERLYEAAFKEMNLAKGIARYPDANSTMRLTYGTVKGYEPADAITYDYVTSTQGVLQKEIPGDLEFDVPANFKDIILKKDFGRYANKDGKMIVNFLSTNDITGGNSGSPIFNKNGELLGLAFDGNWESLSGDIVFEPQLQRTINVDIRYILFVMEKAGGAERLIKELKIK
jgi:hypothetical protein